MKIQPNLGKEDRIIRVAIAAIITLLYLTGIITGTLGIILLLVAIVLLATSLVSTCPLYMILKLNTIRKKLTSGK